MTVEKIENYQKAKAFLEDAKLLLEHQRFNSAISRAYYALFQFSIYLLAQYGETRFNNKWSHYGIQKELREKNIVIADVKAFMILADAYQLRVTSDYHIDNTEKNDVVSTIKNIETFIEGSKL